jgi:outer membrane autotransporter protein
MLNETGATLAFCRNFVRYGFRGLAGFFSLQPRSRMWPALPACSDALAPSQSLVRVRSRLIFFCLLSWGAATSASAQFSPGQLSLVITPNSPIATGSVEFLLSSPECGVDQLLFVPELEGPGSLAVETTSSVGTSNGGLVGLDIIYDGSGAGVAVGESYSGVVSAYECGFVGEGALLDSISVTVAVQSDPIPPPPPSSEVERLDFLNAPPGSLLETSFQVSSENPPITLTTDIGNLSPAQITNSSGTVSFSFQIPADAADGGEYTGTIEISDQGSGDILRIPVRITVQLQSLADIPGLTPLQREVAGALDNACAAIGSIPQEERTAEQDDLAATCERVGQSTTPGALLQSLAPEEVAAQGQASLTTLSQQMGNVTRRMQLLRQGRAGGFDVSDLSLSLDGQVIPVARLADALGTSLGGSAGDLADSGRLGWYISGSGVKGSRRATDRESGVDYRSLGLTAGADYRFSPNTIAGAALGLTRGDSDLKDDSGGVDVDGYSLSLYATHYLPRQFSVDGVLIVGRNEYDTVRTVFSGPDGQKALSSPKGDELGLALSGGYDFVHGPQTVSLLVGVDYLRGRIDAFEERSSDPGAPGAGSLLVIERQTVDSLTTELAVQWSQAFAWRGGVLLPTARLGVEYEHRNDSRSINARFVHDPTETRFTVRTDDPDRTYFNVGAGLSAQFTHGRAAYLFFETVQGRSGVSEQRVDAGVRFEF